MPLHRVTWVSKHTKRVCYHAPEELEAAQAHLSFLRDRHPIIEYSLTPYTPPPASVASDEPAKAVRILSVTAAGGRG